MYVISTYMKDQVLSPQQSLEIITNMIQKAKSNFARGGSFYFILWGFVVAIANLIHFTLNYFTSYRYPQIAWLLIIPAVMWTIGYTVWRRKKSTFVSPIDRICTHIWWGIFACILVILLFMEKVGFYSTPLILLLSALGTYVTGQLLRFRPLIFGGYSLAVTAIVAFLLPLEFQNLVAGLGMLLGYVIPGFLLKKEEK